MPKNLKTYFNGVANTLESKAETAGIYSGRGDIGKCREIVTQEFLSKHVPPRFDVSLGGEIFGYPDQCSGQIDVIINHDMAATFKENSLTRCPVESVVAAISIKSTLDKNQLFDALENLASVPQIDSKILTTGPLTKPFPEYVSTWPSLYVFAFKGMSARTCMEHMATFYEGKNVPLNRIPRAVIVNKKYIIAHTPYEDPGKLKVSSAEGGSGGSPLFWMNHEISKGLSWLNGIYVDYGPYYGIAYPSEE